MNTAPFFYAGVGSQKTPPDICGRMTRIAARLEARGWILRSGAAKGADAAFEAGVSAPFSNARIYLPWKGFNGHLSDHYDVCERAHEIARQYHPAYERLSSDGRLFMARNSYQVLGPFLDAPVACVICWTRNGKAVGGTGQAIRIAADRGIPVFNLHDPTAARRLGELVNQTTPGEMTHG
jgi:hypothetical protein